MTDARRVLGSVFGLDAFHPGQEAEIEGLLGGRTVLRSLIEFRFPTSPRVKFRDWSSCFTDRGAGEALEGGEKGSRQAVPV